jgi:hypothetical protein
LLLSNGKVQLTPEWETLDDEEQVKLIAMWVRGLMELVLRASVMPIPDGEETSAPEREGGG